MPNTRIMPLALLLLSVCSSAQPPKLIVPAGHTGSLSMLKIRKDNQYFISFSDAFFGDNTLKGWDQKTGKLLYSVEKKNPVSFNSNESSFVSLGDIYTAVVRSSHSGEELYRIKATEEEFYSVLFSPRAPVLATLSFSLSSSDTYLCIWAHPGGKLLHRQVAGRGGMGIHFYKPVLQFSPDGKLVFTATTTDSVLRIWEPVTGKLVKELLIPDISSSDLIIHPGGTKLLQHRRMHDENLVWDIKTGKPVSRFSISFDPTLTLSYSPKGNYILARSITHKENNRIYDAITAEDLTGSAGQVQDGAWWDKGLTLDANEKYLLVNDSSRVTKAIDIKTGKPLFYLRDSFNRRPVPQENIFFSPDGKYIVTKSFASVIKVWNSATGKELFQLGSSDYNSSRELEFSGDGHYLVEKNAGAAVKLWDYRNGKLLKELSLRGHITDLVAADISDDGSLLLSSSSDNQVRVWETATGKNLLSFLAHTDRINSIHFSPDGSRFLTSSNDKKVCLWDTRTGTLLRVFLHPSHVRDALFSPDAKHILTICGDLRARTWSAVTGDPVAEFTGHTDFLLSAGYSPDGKRIITTSSDKTVKIWESNGSLLFSDSLKGLGPIHASYRPDGKQILVNEYSGYSLWETGDDTIISSMRSFGPYSNVELSYQYGPRGEAIAWVADTVNIVDPHSGQITRHRFPEGIYPMRYSKSGKTFISTFNGELRVYNSHDYTLRNRLIAIDSTDWFNHVPAGYYQGTQDAVKLLHYVSKELKIISFAQLDVKYNRPDKVLEAIGNTDTALIKSYRKAWEKRIKKLGIDTTQFRDGYSVPECDFANRDAIDYEQKTGILKLVIKGNDSTYKLDRFNVWVNETPIFGQRGFNIRRRNKNDFDTTLTIKLSQGENRIESSITNVNGTESYRMPLLVKYTPAVKQKESLRFIGIGIDKFSDTKYNLQYSSKDIRDLSVKLKEKYGDDITIDTLFNENVTLSNVKELKQKLEQTTVNDKVIISYSGHGLLSKEYDYYLSTYSINFDNPEENGLPYDELENLLDSIPARKKLMLIDACHSGEVDKEEMNKYKIAEDSLKASGTKGGELRYTGNTQLGMKNSFELMQSLFVNVGKSTGATIISAAAGTQFALERGDLKNGVFTYSILEAMDKNPTMKISELKKIVGERVEQLTNGLQKPTSRNETIAVDWNLW